MSDGYRLVFDAMQDWSYYAFVIPGVVLLVVFSVLSYLKVGEPKRRFHPAIAVGAPLFWIIVVLSSKVPPRHELRRALAEGRSELVEGVVTDYHPAPRRGNGALETFTVAGHHFSIASYLEDSPGYNKTQPTGSPIREGVRVRIVDVDGVIARLEVATQ